MPGLALADAGPVLERLAPALLLSDVDGTLVGRDGSLLADLEGKPTLVAAEALVAAHLAGLEVVLVSGRTAAQLRETGRLLGTRDAIAELGTVLVRGREEELVWGEAPRDLGACPAEALERSGALAVLLESFAGRLEPHTPWHLGRRGTFLLRGQAEVAEADALLAGRGLGWARLLDNGRLRGAYPHLGPGPAHAYHLLPAGSARPAPPPPTWPAAASTRPRSPPSATARPTSSWPAWPGPCSWSPTAPGRPTWPTPPPRWSSPPRRPARAGPRPSPPCWSGCASRGRPG